jgi:phosphate:Na+ symporter
MLVGGLGLLLIGMSLMTEGLKIAAGSALRDILAIWTRTAGRGLLSGILITAIVQSSSAVTVATIGFVNAGLLELRQAVWVIFGSNVGTTMTAWIVALVGFRADVEAFALPIIGVGVILRLTGERSRRGLFGQALIGFGLLFLGIGVLKEAFESFGDQFGIPAMQGSGLATIVGYVLVGVLLTTVMQSSSAALVVTLSAAEGGLIPLSAAAALVIGANLGTTTTALMTVWEATPAAKRVAVSHVLFNVLTAAVALIILVPMLALVDWIQRLSGLPEAPATTLAVFHTVFNTLGVLLMWPLADRLVLLLSHRFRSLEEIESRPKYLDRTSLSLPYIAGEALVNEVTRIRGFASRAALVAVAEEAGGSLTLDDDHQIARSLAGAVASYSAELSQTQLPAAVSGVLPGLLRAGQQYGTVIDFARQSVDARGQIGRIRSDELASLLTQFRQQLESVIHETPDRLDELSVAELRRRSDEIDESYADLKENALRDGASGRIDIVQMDALLQYASLTRRVVKQWLRATSRLCKARSELSRGNGQAVTEPEEPAAIETEGQQARPDAERDAPEEEVSEWAKDS